MGEWIVESTCRMVLEGDSWSEPIRVKNGGYLDYNADQHDTSVSYYKETGGTVTIKASRTLRSSKCYFNSSKLLNNTTGAPYYVDTLESGAEWIVDGWGELAVDYGFVTSNGLNIVSHRLITDLIHGGNEKYSGKINRLRLWFDDNSDGTVESYLDVNVVPGYYTEDDDIVPYYFSTDSDTKYGDTFDIITLSVKGIIPEAKYVYDGVNNEYEFLGADKDIKKVEILTESGTIFAFAQSDTSLFTLDYDSRDVLEWSIVLGNDLVPQEWSGWTRSLITQYGLYIAGNRLFWDQNYSPTATGPVGVQLHSYGRDVDMDSSAQSMQGFHWDNDDSGGQWEDITTSIEIDIDDIFHILCPNVWSSMYFDVSIAPSGQSNDYRVTFYYYDGSAWKIIPSISDGTDDFTKSGKVEFHAPEDWQPSDDPYDQTYNGYGMRIKVEAASLTTAPTLDLNDSVVYYAEPKSNDASPGNLQSVKVADIPIPFTSGPPKALLSAKFTADDIGRVMNEDGYLASGNTKRIRGISLTNYDPLKHYIQEAVHVLTASAGTATDPYLTFSSTTYPLEPQIIMIVRDKTTGELLPIEPTFVDITETGGNWYIRNFDRIDINNDYEVWYMPKEIDLSSELTYKIHSVYGRPFGHSVPNITMGYVRSDVLYKNPEEILSYIGNLDSKSSFYDLPLKSFINRTEMRGGHKGLRVDKDGFHIPDPDLGPAGWISKKGEPEVVGLDYYHIDLDFDRNKKVIRGNDGWNAVFSYRHDDTWLAAMLAFDNPGHLGSTPIKLDMSMSHNSEQNILGADIYVWAGDNEAGFVWEHVGSFTPEVGQHTVYANEFILPTDNIIDMDPIYILITSKYPSFSRMNGLMIRGDVSEESLDKTYEEIYSEYNGSLDFGYNSSVRPIDSTGNDQNFWFMYARLIGAPLGNSGSNQRYIDGIDYIWDTLNQKIEFPDIFDSREMPWELGRPLWQRKGYPIPKIMWQTDTFTSIGAVDDDNFGQLSNGEDIDTDKESGGYNFRFALSKVPYLGRGMIKAVIKKESIEILEPNDINIVWDSGIEYSTEEEYQDTKIKSDHDGHGRYVAELTSHKNAWVYPGTNYIGGTLSITYPYLADNYYEVIYIEDVGTYTFSKSYFEHNTFTPPFQVSNRDRLNVQTQIAVAYPREREPSLTLEGEQ